jgi:hypothetical protein
MDTTQREIYRRMRPAQRLQAGCALHDFAVRRLERHLRRVMAGASEAEIRLAILRRFGCDPARVFHPGPPEP